MPGQEDLGNIKINDDVVALIASLALVDVDGVFSISGRSSFSDYVGSKARDADKGITVKIDEATGLCTVGVEINIEYGVPIWETAQKLQRKIKNSIETFTGLTVDKVNVTIRGIIVLEQPRTAHKNAVA